MIVKDIFRLREDGVVLYKTYSSEGYYIKKLGANKIYSEAVDIENANYIYEETDKKIEKKTKEHLIKLYRIGGYHNSSEQGFDP